MTNWRWQPPSAERDQLLAELREAKAEIENLNRQVAESAGMLQRLRDQIHVIAKVTAKAQSTPELPCQCSKCSKPWNWRETR